jgi:hypothetical protein
MDHRALKVLHCLVKKSVLQKQRMDPLLSVLLEQRVIRVMLGNQDLRGCRVCQDLQGSLV